MHLEFDHDTLRALVRPIVTEILEQVDQTQRRLGDGRRLAFTESEAASLLGIAKHNLRDCRLREEITGAKVGNKTVYEATELRAFLARQRME